MVVYILVYGIDWIVNIGRVVCRYSFFMFKYRLGSWVGIRIKVKINVSIGVGSILVILIFFIFDYVVYFFIFIIERVVR